ncbi:CpaF family protein, partial [archaeon]|nr:CpaF family protein [archaeon]
LKDKFKQEALKKIGKKFPMISEKKKRILAGLIVNKMYGLKDIEILMSDENVEEISINGSNYPMAIYHRTIGWCMTNIKATDEEEILNIASSIGRKVGKTISTMNPLLDAHLVSGDRVQATLFPISSSGNTITIRKFAKSPWTITKYINNGTVNSEVAALLWLSIQYELSVMIAGGTASGKTSCLNALTAFIHPNHRVISIEDVREINLPKSAHWNWVPLTTREARAEGAGNVSMLNLMVTSLRMRPDRIIVGEVRKKRQAEVLFEAIHTGHSVYTTLHADTAEQAYIRLVEDPISIPKAELEGLHLIAIMFRDRRKGFRKLFQVAEILPIPGEVGERDIKIRLLYRWSPKTDKWEKLQESQRVINSIALHTGLSEDAIMKELEEKKIILDWMTKHKILEMDDFGKIIDEYYQDPQKVVKLAKKNKSPGALL